MKSDIMIANKVQLQPFYSVPLFFLKAGRGCSLQFLPVICLRLMALLELP